MRNTSTTSSLGLSCLIATACLVYAGLSERLDFPVERAEIGVLSLGILALSLVLGIVLHGLARWIGASLDLGRGFLASVLGLTALLVQIAFCLSVIDSWSMFF